MICTMSVSHIYVCYPQKVSPLKRKILYETLQSIKLQLLVLLENGSRAINAGQTMTQLLLKTQPNSYLVPTSYILKV